MSDGFLERISEPMTKLFCPIYEPFSMTSMRCVRVGVDDAPSRRLTQFELSGLFIKRAPFAPRTLHRDTRFLDDARALSGEFRSRMTSKQLTWSRESADSSLQLFRAAARVNRIHSRTFIHIPIKELDGAAHSLACVHSLSPRNSRHFPERARTPPNRFDLFRNAIGIHASESVFPSNFAP